MHECLRVVARWWKHLDADRIDGNSWAIDGPCSPVRRSRAVPLQPAQARRTWSEDGGCSADRNFLRDRTRRLPLAGRDTNAVGIFREPARMERFFLRRTEHCCTIG